MDTRILALAKQIVALLEKTPTAPPPVKTAAVKPAAVKPAKPPAVKKGAAKQGQLIPGTHSTIKVRTFAKLPKNKQAYITKKQNEARRIFKREYSNVPQDDVTKLINETTKECVEYGFINHPKKWSMKQWKEATDEAFDKLVEEDSDDEEESDDDEE